MNPFGVILSVAVLASAALAQLPPTFFTSGFHGGFQGFSGFGSPQIVSSPFSPSGGSGGRSNTGTTVQGSSGTRVVRGSAESTDYVRFVRPRRVWPEQVCKAPEMVYLDLAGPILFPPAPESRDTSGVIVGASGYGFVPPGVNEIIQGRGLQSSSPFQSSLRQSFGNYFHL